MVRVDQPQANDGDIGSPYNRRPLDTADALQSDFYNQLGPEQLDDATAIASRTDGVRSQVRRNGGDVLSKDGDAAVELRIADQMKIYRQMVREGGTPSEFEEIVEDQRGIDMLYKIPGLARVLNHAIATKLFSIEGNWRDTRDQVTNKISGLPGASLDGNPINWNTTNDYEDKVNSTGNLTVNWITDDFSEIRHKLELAGLWFAFTDQNDTSPQKQFILLKARQTIISKVVTNELGRLKTESIFDPRRLSNMASATDDPADPNSKRPLLETLNNILEEGTMNKLQNIAPEHPDYQRTTELRALLAYIDKLKRKSGGNKAWIKSEIYKYMQTLESSEASDTSGTVRQIDKVTNTLTKVNQLIRDREILNQNITSMTNVGGNVKLPESHWKDVEKARNDLTKKEQEISTQSTELYNTLKDESLTGLSIPELTNLYDSLDNNPPSSVSNYGSFIDTIYTDSTAQSNINTMTKKLNAKKDNLNKSNSAKDNPRLTPRQLLVKIIEKEQEIGGATEGYGRLKDSMITAGMLVADARTAAIVNAANAKHGDRLNQGVLGKTWEGINSHRFFSSNMTAKDSIRAITSTNQDLRVLGEIIVPSTAVGRFFSQLPTRQTLMNEIRVKDPSFNTDKLRKMSTMLGEVMKGFEYEGRKVQLRKSDAQFVEHYIRILNQAEVELDVQDRMQKLSEKGPLSKDEFYKESLDMIKGQEQASANLDERLKHEVEPYAATWRKAFYRPHLLSQYRTLRAQAKEQGLKGKELDDYYERNGVPKHLRKAGVFSVRFQDWLSRKETWKGIGKGLYYGTVAPYLAHQTLRGGWWATKGVGRGIGRGFMGIGRWGKNSVMGTVQRFKEISGSGAQKVGNSLKTGVASLGALAVTPVGIAAYGAGKVLQAPLWAFNTSLNILTLGYYNRARGAGAKPAVAAA